MSTNYTDLLYKEEKGIATITINRPKVLNAFTAHTVEELICLLYTSPSPRDS